MKNKGLIITLSVIGVIVIIFAILAISSYNGLVDQEEAVNAKQSTISVQLQRRADLIPNFVETVKGYSDYEQSTYTAVTEARSAVMKANGAEDQAAASAQLDSAIDIWVNAITEAYPELKANTQFTALTDELSGTENRIAVARKDYNEEAKEYNTEIKKFPKSIIAGLFGFEAYDYFENAPGTENVPQVNFN